MSRLRLWGAGAVLAFAGGALVFVTRGPAVAWPMHPGGAVLLLLGTHVLGELARLGAVALRWGAHAVFAADPFGEERAAEAIDEPSPRRLAPEVQERLVRASASLGVALAPIARADDEATRDRKAARAEEALEIVRASAPREARELVLELEARAEAARAMTAALALASLAFTALAIHDLVFAHAVAHAANGFTTLGLGVVAGLAALAALGHARGLGRQAAREGLLLLLRPVDANR